MKANILSRIRPIQKNIFGIHDPVGLRYLFQLRVGLSPLRHHKKLHNFADTPSEICPCNHGVEDTKHFLFCCPLYGPMRATLAACVIPILQKYDIITLSNKPDIYLYGHHSINNTDSKIILNGSIKYFKETKRFEMR